MRYFASSLIALVLLFLAFWGGSRIALMVNPPHREYNDYTVGRKMDLCGYAVDSRHVAGGYDLGQWRDRRCESLSDLDRCMLGCLSVAGTVEIGAACYSDCFDE
jgi:hypothetical protein